MEQPPTFGIKNTLCQRAGINFAWIPCDNIGVFPYERKHSGAPDKPSQHAPTDVSIFQVRQDVILFNPELRKLVNESSGTFENLQKRIAKKNSADELDLVRISRQYRAIIRACLENLQEEMLTRKSEDEDVKNYITIFYSVECIWHLCEILFVNSTPGNVVLPQLLDWIRFHFPKHERNAASLLSGNLNSLDMYPHYWFTVIGLLLQGHVKVARGLLKQHSMTDSAAFKIVDKILKAIPLYDVYSGLSIEEFKLQWNHWVVDVQSKIDAKVFITNKNLDFIMRLMVKDENAWSEAQQYCETWYQYLAAWLFYTAPAVKSFELGEFAKTCISKMGVGDKLKHLDQVLLGAMEHDVLEVIKQIQCMSEGGWFATHLTNLLYHSGILTLLEKDIEDFSAKSLHEFLLVDYGSLLMGHKSLWQVGLTYLDCCSLRGLKTIELLLPRIYPDSEMKANKLVKEAQKRNLSKVCQTICKIEGMKSMRRDRLGNALTWALKSQDCIFISLVADKFLRSYIATGKLGSSDLLYNLGSSMLASDRLIFLGKYYEFHKFYQEKQYKEAGDLLVKLLESKIIPKYFWYILLIEAIPLLESQEIVFSTNDTYLITNCIEENSGDENLKNHVDILRLALARNLSRAIIFEAQNIM